MHQIINDIISSTRQRVENIQVNGPQQTITTRSLIGSVRSVKERHNIPVIAEVKPASPTTYNRDVSPVEAADIARTMEAAGAAAISVLTEPEFFNGSLDNLEQVRKAVNIPVLRKDFILDTRQLYEAQSDLILLIAGILGGRLPEFIRLATKRGIQPLVEVHTEEELVAALQTDARIIGINNRNLTTMDVDLATTEVLAPLVREYGSRRDDGSPDVPDRIIISESGILTPDDANRVIQAGADAILVGTSLMKGDIYRNTKNLVEANISPGSN